ncbi:MotA/TolQ/ExbB proton channel family protein [Pelagicoccus sp. SDUM812002]|uniref:MotA/TolQ/ExbB proton channel family protein n=1 Tax=Pelagicoccus sp. SDUM812002 TaxID=3041266 RepID=UPI0028109837|nr:MotA/TolQ/ExbB proton channel family protein [Pelagicoccus sp. SDUM812002]MDQ8187162.1 MotA/TolQ/ExbB proton channel family protein [Pelagicoccus sp. SDUM812002]
MRIPFSSPLRFLALASLLPLLHSQSDVSIGGIESAIPELETELSEAVGNYNRVIEEIEKEKLDLVRKTNALDQLVLERKEALRERQLAASLKAQAQNTAREQLDALKGQSSYIDGVLRDFTNNFLTRIDFTEYQIFLQRITDINEKTRIESVPYDTKITEQLKAIEMTIDQLENAIGGYQFRGNALSPTGTLLTGSITRVGPSSYFTAEDTGQSGILTPNIGTIEPKIVSISATSDLDIASVTGAQQGRLPVDISTNALKLNRERGTLLEHIQKGGWVGYVILTLGTLSTLLVIVKFLSIKSENPTAPTNLKQIIKEAKLGHPESANKLLSTKSKSVRRLIANGIENINESTDMLEECLLSNVLDYKLKLERFVPLLALTAATAPLLGLLGTVVGMIKTFTLITVFGTGDASSLSSGISEALVTTELGLVIAVPALIFHGLVIHMIQSRTTAMERITFEVIKESSRSLGVK